MAVKTITITEEAYRRLARLKREGESFSDVIIRMSAGRSLLEFAGKLDPEAGDRTSEEVERMRREVDRRVRRIAGEIRG